jgi:DNA-binding beta-propeller fold protein YncE
MHAGQASRWRNPWGLLTVNRVASNVPSAGALVVVDRTTMKAVASWPVTSAHANYPLAIDEAGHRLFIGCRQPARVLVYDSGTGRELASFDTVGDTDDVFFDAARQRLYISGGEGFIDVVDTHAASGYTRITRIPTAAGARTALFVPAANRFVLAVPKRHGHTAQLRVFAVE